MINPWYGSAAAKTLLSDTDGGRLMFVWVALLKDGTTVSQFEEHTMSLLLGNPDITPPSALKVSTSAIPRDKVIQFTILPTARTKKACPWFNQEGLCFNQFVDPAKEELLAYWLVDRHVVGGPGVWEIARQVFGVENRETHEKSLTVICPTGKAVQGLKDDNQSYEGE